MYIKTVLFSSSFSDEGITYFVPVFLEEKIKIGQIILVPYWKQIKDAVVLEVFDEIDFDENKVKSIIEIKSDTPLLLPYQIKLVSFIAKKYFSLIHHSLNLFFPKNLKEKIRKNKIPEILFKSSFQENKESKKNIELSAKQKEVFEKINNSKNKNILFHWITWSWKTEIYMKIIEENLKQNKQTLILVPEIILNSQIFERIEKIFPENIVLINSTVSEAKKTKIWLDIYNEKSKIVVWTRSALFYPYANLWIIIVDEEHDNSYFSDKNPRYSGVDIALQIWKILDIKVILASWTPKINDMYMAIKWKFKLISLMEKFKK